MLQVLHSMVSSVERPPTTPAGSQLILRCKDFRVFQILIPQERDCLDVHASLVRLSRPGVSHLTSFFFFFFLSVSSLSLFHHPLISSPPFSQRNTASCTASPLTPTPTKRSARSRGASSTSWPTIRGWGFPITCGCLRRPTVNTGSV